MTMHYEGTYKFKRSFEFAREGVWQCKLKFDGLMVEVYAHTQRGSIRKVNKAMRQAVSLRTAVLCIKGLCDDGEV